MRLEVKGRCLLMSDEKPAVGPVRFTTLLTNGHVPKEGIALESDLSPFECISSKQLETVTTLPMLSPLHHDKHPSMFNLSPLPIFDI
jgi:hypothetical protein